MALAHKILCTLPCILCNQINRTRGEGVSRADATPACRYHAMHIFFWGGGAEVNCCPCITPSAPTLPHRAQCTLPPPFPGMCLTLNLVPAEGKVFWLFRDKLEHRPLNKFVFRRPHTLLARVAHSLLLRHLVAPLRTRLAPREPVGHGGFGDASTCRRLYLRDLASLDELYEVEAHADTRALPLGLFRRWCGRLDAVHG